MNRLGTIQKVFVAIVISMVAAASGCAGANGLFGEPGMFDGSKLFSGFGGDSIGSVGGCSGST